MPTPPLREDHPKMQRALDAWLKADYNYSAGAKLLELPDGTFRHQVNPGLAEGLTPRADPVKPRIRIPARSTPVNPTEFGKSVRVVTWGCAHDAPNIPDKSRFRNVGLLCAELRPDFIVELGDTADLDSLSTHDIPGSAEDRARPAFLTEIQSLEDAMGAFHAVAPPPEEIPRFRTKGNHCHRADRFEARSPVTEGLYTLPLSQVFARCGFTEKQFREWLFIEGVGFTHAPINAMGREMGGVNANQTVARETTFSVVWAHTHRREFVDRSKIGIGNSIQVYNVGSFMPQGLIKPYAGLSQTGWTYGASELTLRNGQIESARYYSELEMRERYA